MDRRGVLAAMAALFTVGCSSRGRDEAGTRATTTASTPLTVIESQDQDQPEAARTGDRAEDDRSRMRTDSPIRAVRRIRAARDRLKTAPSTFETEFDRVDYFSRSAQFDREPVETVLNEARTELQAAADVATDEQKRTIDALGEYIELFERLLAVPSPLVNDHPALTEFAPYAGYEVAANDLERAKSWLDEVRQPLELAWVGFRTARMELADPATVGLEGARGILTRFDTFVAGLETGFDGDRELLRGWKDFRSGREDYEKYDLEDVKLVTSSFRSAEAHFHQAEDMYIKAESIGPTKLESLFRSRQCQSRNYRKAAEQMRYAAAVKDHVLDEARKYSSEATGLLYRDCTF